MSTDHSRTSLPLTHAAASDQANQTPAGPARGSSARGSARGISKRGRGNSTGGRGRGTDPTATAAAAAAGRAGPGLGRAGEDPRHRAIALHHAHRIQAQKDTEALILDRILSLTATFPSPATTDPAHPAASDSHVFKTYLTPFQPADYDNLVQERNIEGRCGYGLCPHEHRKDAGGGPGGGDRAGSFRIRYGAPGSGPGGRGREMNIVPKEKLEMWCSDACAERALYIRVQLMQEPVWERRGADMRELVLLEEGRATSATASTVGQVTEQLGQMNMHPESASGAETDTGTQPGRESGRELALERGDSNEAFLHGRVDVHVRENQTPAVPPQLRPEDAHGGSIEGYVPSPRPE